MTKRSVYRSRSNIYIPVHGESHVQELSDGTLIFYVDVRSLPEDTSETMLRFYLKQFERDIMGEE